MRRCIRHGSTSLDTWLRARIRPVRQEKVGVVAGRGHSLPFAMLACNQSSKTQPRGSNSLDTWLVERMRPVRLEKVAGFLSLDACAQTKCARPNSLHTWLVARIRPVLDEIRRTEHQVRSKFAPHLIGRGCPVMTRKRGGLVCNACMQPKFKDATARV